jgi:hypothetical protein
MHIRKLWTHSAANRHSLESYVWEDETLESFRVGRDDEDVVLRPNGQDLWFKVTHVLLPSWARTARRWQPGALGPSRNHSLHSSQFCWAWATDVHYGLLQVVQRSDIARGRGLAGTGESTFVAASSLYILHQQALFRINCLLWLLVRETDISLRTVDVVKLTPWAAWTRLVSNSLVANFSTFELTLWDDNNMSSTVAREMENYTSSYPYCIWQAVEVEGGLVEVAVSGDGSDVWGVNRLGLISHHLC